MNKQDRVDALHWASQAGEALMSDGPWMGRANTVIPLAANMYEKQLQGWMQRMTGIHPYMTDVQDPTYDDHRTCPSCSRRFINNISCPRCGWMVPR